MPSLRRLLARERDGDRRVQDLVAALVGGAEHQRRHAVERRDDRDLGEDDAREGPREAREDDAGEQRDGQDAEERLDAHDDVGVDRLRHEHGVVDRADGLDAEQERVPEIAVPRMRQPVGIGKIEQGEDDVDRREEGGEAEEERPPRRGQHAMIEVGEPRPVLPFDDGNAPPARLTRKAASDRGLRCFRVAHAVRITPSWCGKK